MEICERCGKTLIGKQRKWCSGHCQKRVWNKNNFLYITKKNFNTVLKKEHQKTAKAIFDDVEKINVNRSIIKGGLMDMHYMSISNKDYEELKKKQFKHITTE